MKRMRDRAIKNLALISKMVPVCALCQRKIKSEREREKC